MENGRQERTISLEALKHYTQLPEKLVLKLTSDERMELLRTPIPSLPNPVSQFYRVVHEILCAGSEGKEVTLENKIMAAFVRSELPRQCTPPELNEDTLQVIGYFSDTKTLGRLSQTNKRAYLERPCLFKAALSARELVRAVFDADLEGKATKFIGKITPENYHIVLERVFGEKERFSRVWKGAGVSALEFTAWIGDVTLMNALLAKVPAHKKVEALKQLIGVKENGLEHGSHMAPFHVLIDKIKTYDKDFFQFKDGDAQDEYCIKIIGGAEKLLSLFGLQWFCDSKPFDRLTKFDRAPDRGALVDGLSLLFVLSDLGDEFFIYKFAGGGCLLGGPGAPGTPGQTRWRGWGRLPPLAALESLCQVGRVALDNAISQLQHEIAATLTNSNS